MRISDWSSDVCSSDLYRVVDDKDFCDQPAKGSEPCHQFHRGEGNVVDAFRWDPEHQAQQQLVHDSPALRWCDFVSGGLDRKSVAWGTSVSGRVDLGGRRIMTKKKIT